MQKISYQSTPEFNKDFKKLCKKYKTLKADLEQVKKRAIELYHIHEIDNNAIFPIEGFCSETVLSCKVKKFASKCFKGKGAKSGLRLIYIYLVEDRRAVFNEIYYKGVKENEDKVRLQSYFNQLN